MIAIMSYIALPLIRKHQSFRPVLVFGILLSMMSGSIAFFEPKSAQTYRDDNLVGTMMEDRQDVEIDNGMFTADTASTSSTAVETDEQILLSNNPRRILRSPTGTNDNQEERGLQSCSTCYQLLHEDPYCASGSVADKSQFRTYYKYFSSAPDTSCIYACCQSFEKDCCISTGGTDDSTDSDPSPSYPNPTPSYPNPTPSYLYPDPTPTYSSDDESPTSSSDDESPTFSSDDESPTSSYNEVPTSSYNEVPTYYGNEEPTYSNYDETPTFSLSSTSGTNTTKNNAVITDSANSTVSDKETSSSQQSGSSAQSSSTFLHSGILIIASLIFYL